MYTKPKRLPGLSLSVSVLVVTAAARTFPIWQPPTGRKKELTIEQALKLCLLRLRGNNTFHELGILFNITTSTAWEYHQLMLVFLAEEFGCTDTDLPELLADKICLIDGTYIRVWNWKHRDDLYSGKRKANCMNLQVASDLFGRLIAASQPFPGSWHDLHCWQEANWQTKAASAGSRIGDSGYQGGQGLIVPIKKHKGQPRAEADKQFNTQLAKLRVPVEWGNAHLKNWRLLTTIYRSQLHGLPAHVTAIIGLQKLNEQHTPINRHFDRVTNI